MALDATDLLALSRRLRQAGQGDLVKIVERDLRTSARPLVPATRAAARASLPTGGGLAERIARAPRRVTSRIGNTTVSVKVTAGSNRKTPSVRTTDEGRVRHPIFNRRDAAGKRPFVTQAVPSGWFTDTVEAAYPGISTSLQARLARFARDTTQG